MKGSNIMKKAFTLAEVLITLAIIGVVAALTIPSVILNTNQTEYKSSLKKAVSVLNQAVSLRMAVENDTPSVTSSTTELMELIASQMNTVNVGYTSAAACTALPIVLDKTEGGKTTAQSLTAYLNNATGRCYFTTTDGMQYWLIDDGDATVGGIAGVCEHTGEDGKTTVVASTREDKCTETAGNTWKATPVNEFQCTASKPCYLAIDVNGDKNPNKWTDYNEDGTVNVQDRFVLQLSGENGTSILPFHAAADVMYQK